MWGDDEPWVSIADMNQGLIINWTKERLSAAGAAKGKLVLPGTVLLSFKLSIGKVARAAMPLYTNEAIAALPIKDPTSVEATYLMRALQAQDLSSGSNRAAMGATLNKASLRSIRIPLPSLDEQRRIATILDKADAIRTKRRQVLEQLRNLEFALQFEIFGDLRRNSKHWPILPFGRLVVNEDKQRVPLRVADRSLRHGPYPYYGASGIIDFIDDYIFEGKKLLISEDGANLAARTKPIAFIAEGQYWVNNHAHVVSPNSRVNIEYLCAVINKIDISAFVGGSAQPKLTRASLDRLQIPVPPIELQEEYRRKLALIYELKLTSQVMEKASRALFASLQSRAFKGEL